MAERTIHPLVKSVLEFGPVLAFFAAYLMLKDEIFTIGSTEYEGFILVTAGFVPLMVLSTGILWKLTGKLSKMQALTLILIVVFGGLSVWLNDERFFKMKTSIVYGVFAAILGIGLLRGQSYLRYIMEDCLPMEKEGWMILMRRLVAMFEAMALANAYIWRTQTTELWFKLETFAFPVVLFLFLWSQIVLLQKYLIEPEA